MFEKGLKIKPKPDFNRFKKILLRQGTPDRVPFYELFSNIQDSVLKITGKWQEPPDLKDEKAQIEWGIREHIQYMYSLGYDYLNAPGGRGFGFPRKESGHVGMTKEGERGYVSGSDVTIANREDFEKYAWPDMKTVDYSSVELLEKYIPEGMLAIGSCSGVLENVMGLLGYEGISYLLYEDSALVKDMFEAIGTRFIAYFDALASFEIIGAIQIGDDMGFKTQTMLSPAVFREFVFPWHRKIVETVHKHGKPIILHACGNLKEVMEDIIACGWDAKHSYEDAIEPVWEAKENYGSRISVLGGFDMDKLSRMTEKEVRNHTRFLIDRCAPGGGWMLGSGNSVANYVPPENFLAMLEEGYLYGKY